MHHVVYYMGLYLSRNVVFTLGCVVIIDVLQIIQALFILSVLFNHEVPKMNLILKKTNQLLCTWFNLITCNTFWLYKIVKFVSLSNENKCEWPWINCHHGNLIVALTTEHHNYHHSNGLWSLATGGEVPRAVEEMVPPETVVLITNLWWVCSSIKCPIHYN